MIRRSKLLLDLSRTGLDGLRGRTILRRNLYLSKRLLDVRKIILRRQPAAGAVRCPFMLNESASRHNRQDVLDGLLRHWLRRSAIVRVGTVVVLRPQTMHDETEVLLGIALAR